MKRKLFLIVLLVSFLSPASFADGFIIPGPPPGGGKLPPNLSIKYHDVDIKIDGQVARTTVDQVFMNNFHRDIEGTYIFPIPEGASISDFSMYVGGEELKGKLMDRDEARSIYSEIVRRRRDPALLEYFKNGMFKASVYPIPANGETRIKLYYSELLKLDGGICSYRYTLSTEKFSRDPLQRVRVNIQIKAKNPIKNIYSPSHDIKIERKDNYHAVVTYTAENTKPNTDFILYYTFSKDDIGFDLLTFEDDDGGKYFMAMISPSVEIDDDETSGKNITFILDSSGSMQGEKIEQARRALSFCLNGLGERDSFNVIDFDDQVRTFSTSPVTADRNNIREAVDFVGRCEASGGTNINDALLTGLDRIEGADGTSFIIFLTDGLPTVGETDIQRIISNVESANKEKVKLFVFGVGYDVNTRLLDRLALDSRAVSDYVLPSEDIEVKVSSFYGKISHPILTDVKLDIDDIDLSEIYPRQLPDIFKGTQLLILGKYEGSGRSRVTLTGTSRGSNRRYTYRARFSPGGGNDFIPRLWATRRIGYLVDQLRLHGNDRELVNEVVRLSKRYGIMTEYTSFLVDADYRLAYDKLAERAEEKMVDAMKKDVGKGAVYRAKSGMALKAGSIAPQSFIDSEGNEQETTAITRVGTRTFFNRDGRWIDSEYEGKTDALKVKKFSNAYFKLLRRFPKIGRYLSIGEDVIFILNGTPVQVSDEGKSDITSDEMDRLDTN